MRGLCSEGSKQPHVMTSICISANRMHVIGKTQLAPAIELRPHRWGGNTT